jgi:hypothetical protein
MIIPFFKNSYLSIPLPNAWIAQSPWKSNNPEGNMTGAQAGNTTGGISPSGTSSS